MNYPFKWRKLRFVWWETEMDAMGAAAIIFSAAVILIYILIDVA